MPNNASKIIEDIPMGRDVSSRYVLWIIGLMVYLLSLIFVGSFSLSASLNQWQLGGISRITVEVPLQGVQSPDAMVDSVVGMLKAVPAISKITIVDSQQVLELLQPWVGQVNLLQGLVLPALIDVDLKDNATIDIRQLTTGLRQISAGIRIEEHSHWQHMLETLRLSLELLSYLFIGLIVGTVMIAISLITCSSLSTHANIIDVLRLIGATNTYIARKFQKRAFLLALKGGAWGVLVALPTIFILNWLSLQLGVPDVIKPTLNWLLIVIILALPFLVGGMSLIVARFSVFRTLSKLG